MNKIFKYLNRQSVFSFNRFNKFNFAEKKPEVKDNKAIPFVPYDDLTLKDRLDRLNTFKKEVDDNYGSYVRAQQSKIFNKQEFDAKKRRQHWFRTGDVYHTQKHIIPVKRMRTKDDTLFGLLKNGEIACVLQGREEFDELHFVVDKKYIKHLDAKPMANTRTLYLKLDNEEIRCTMINKERHISIVCSYSPEFPIQS